MNYSPEKDIIEVQNRYGKTGKRDIAESDRCKAGKKESYLDFEAVATSKQVDRLTREKTRNDTKTWISRQEMTNE